MIKEGDKVKLKTGEIAFVSEVLEHHKMYIGEIIRVDRHVDIDHIPFDDIVSIFEEVERPVSKAV